MSVHNNAGECAVEETRCEHGCTPTQCLACYVAEHDPRNPTRREMAVQFALKLIERTTALDKRLDAEDVSSVAVALTDALLAELEKGKQNGKD